MTKAWDFLISMITGIDFVDVIDILLVAALLYGAYMFIRNRRAVKLIVGVVLVVFIHILSRAIGLHALQFIIGNVYQVGLIALIIVFQPELRSALEKLGGEPLKGIKSIGEHKKTEVNKRIVKELCEAVTQLSESKTGALIVIERSTKLGDVIDTGVVVNADISSFLVRNIFFNKAPLHDGAMILRDGRVHAAGCFLPLSSNDEIIKDLGTRHRAGIGMSENSDAVVVIVSEETGTISVAQDGQLRRNYNYSSLKKLFERIGLQTMVKSGVEEEEKSE